MPRFIVPSFRLMLALCVAAAPARAVQVQIDASVTYQTVDGVGMCGVPAMWKVKQGPFFVDQPFEPFADTLVNLIGITMLRGFSTASCDFNPAPGQYVIPGDFRSEMQRDSVLTQKALAAGQPMRFSPNAFSPPAWMKQNSSCASTTGTYATDPTNSLIPAHYADFAALCSAFVRICADTFHVPCYAFSPQNEPFFNENYASCSYADGSGYGLMLAVVGPAVAHASPTTLIYGCEHMAWAFPSWENALMQNPSAAPYLARFAVHGYTDGVHVDTTTFDTLSSPRARPLWLSEFNWGAQTYADAFTYANTVMKSLVVGSLSGYLAGGELWDPTNGAKYPGYYLNAQFFRFVRPGMTRVKATCADSSLLIGVFGDAGVGSLSAVMMNMGASDAAVTLSIGCGSLPDSFEIRTTSPTLSFVDGGTVASTATITVPASGMVSLGYRIRSPSLRVTTPHRTVAGSVKAPTAASVARIYDITGRRLTAGSRGLAPGAYVLTGIGVRCTRLAVLERQFQKP